MSRILLSVPDMSSHHCVRRISASVSDVPGVEAVQVDLDGRRVEVEGPVDESAVRAAVTDAGYEVA